MKLDKNQLILMFGEFTDRLNFYGIQSILTLYLMHVFLFSSGYSLTIYGIYSSLGFIAPLIGGYCADRFGHRHKFTLLGIVFILLGNIFLLLNSKTTLFLGIDLVIIGIGFFKPNNITLFGGMCKDSNQKYAAFTLYYAVMTAGAIFGPFIYSTLGVIVNWQASFIASIIFSLISLTFYMLRINLIYKLPTTSNRDNTIFFKIIFLIIAMFVVIYLCLEYNQLFTILIWGSGLAVVGFLVYFMRSLTKVQRNQQIMLLILMIFGLLFYAVSFQVSSALLLYINSDVKAKIFGFAIPPEYFMSIYSIFLAIVAVLSAKIWHSSTKLTNNMLIFKINASLYLGAISFFVLALSAFISNSAIIWQIIFILVGLFILGIGELYVGPVINAAISQLVPQNKNGAFMGLWCLLIGYAAYLSSLMAKMVDLQNYMKGQCIYFQTFILVGLITLIIAITMTLMKRYLNSLIPN